MLRFLMKYILLISPALHFHFMYNIYVLVCNKKKLSPELQCLKLNEESFLFYARFQIWGFA